jgi:hypothetical protein
VASAAKHHFATVIRPALENAQRLQEWLHATWLRSAPDNWHDLEDQQLDLFDFVEESGLCLVWAPRPDVIRALLTAEPSDRYDVLAACTDDVLDDLEAVLAAARGVEVSGHTDACEFAAEAIAAARDGHFHGAQTLAASGIGQILHATLGFQRLGAAFKRFNATDLNEATMELIKISLLEVSTARALTNYTEVDPAGFNRHATQHGERSFFSQSNALAALLLLVGWLREFKWVAEYHPEAIVDTDDAPEHT